LLLFLFLFLRADASSRSRRKGLLARRLLSADVAARLSPSLGTNDQATTSRHRRPGFGPYAVLVLFLVAICSHQCCRSDRRLRRRLGGLLRKRRPNRPLPACCLPPYFFGGLPQSRKKKSTSFERGCSLQQTPVAEVLGQAQRGMEVFDKEKTASRVLGRQSGEEMPICFKVAITQSDLASAFA